MKKDRFIFLLPITLVLFIFLSPLTSFSQETESVDSSKKELGPLGMLQIPAFGKDTRNLINDIKLIVNNHEEQDEIEPELDEVLTLLDKKLTALSDTSKIFRLDALEKEDRELSLLNQRIVQWKTTTLDLSRVGQNKDSLASSMIHVWQSTLDSIKISQKHTSQVKEESQKTNDIKTEVIQFIDDLHNSQNALHIYLDSIQNIQADITIAENKIGSISDLIQVSRAHQKQSIWLPESPPIWEVKKDTTAGGKKRRITDLVAADSSIINAFLKNNPKLPYYFAVLIALVFGLILYLRPRTKTIYNDFKDEFKEANVLLDHPLLSALIIAWFATLLITSFPRELKDLISLLMFAPLLIVLRKLNPNWKWQTLLVFSCSYLLFLIIREIDYTHLTQRIFLIFVNLLALLLFLYFRKQKEQMEKLRKFWFGTLPFIINLFIAVGILSLLASIFGSIELSQLLSHMLLGTILSIHILKTAVLLLRNFVFLILMGPLLRYSNILKEESKLVLTKMDTLFRLIGFIALIYVLLEMLSIRKAIVDAFVGIINYPIEMGEMSISLGNILAFFITIQVAIWISSLTRFVLEKEVFPRTRLKQGVPNTILIMTKFTIVLLGILLAFSAAGVKMDKIAIAMGALGVGIGFGLQNIISNFISGIILALERPITIGDLIEIPNVSGVVKDIGIRASTVRTWDGSDVIVPNAELISNKLTNWTFYDRLRRVKTEVRVPFDTNIEAVSQLLLKAAGEIDEVMEKPKPYLNFKGIGTSAMEITLYCWINDSDKIFSYGTAIRKGVYKALQDAGYDMPVPVQELKIDSETEKKAKTD